MVGVLKELLVLPVALAMMVRAEQRRWRSDNLSLGSLQKIGLNLSFVTTGSIISYWI